MVFCNSESSEVELKKTKKKKSEKHAEVSAIYYLFDKFFIGEKNLKKLREHVRNHFKIFTHENITLKH